MRLFLFVQPLLVILLTTISAAAQTAPAAEALYHRGVADFQAGRYEAACRALAESYRLEALPGVLFTLATCEARAGRVASSATHYQDFLELVSRLPAEQRVLQQEREQVALAERRALLPDVPTLRVAVQGTLPAGARVLCDDVELGATALGRELPMDPGQHLLALVLADGSRSETRVLLARRAHERATLIVPQAAHELAPSRAQRARHIGALTGLVVGGAGVVTGVLAGSLAWKHKREVDAHCEDRLCDAAGKNAADRGQVEALTSTIGYGVGVAGLAVFLILHFTGPRDTDQAADRSLSRLVLTPNGVAFGATF